MSFPPAKYQCTDAVLEQPSVRVQLPLVFADPQLLLSCLPPDLQHLAICYCMHFYSLDEDESLRLVPAASCHAPSMLAFTASGVCAAARWYDPYVHIFHPEKTHCWTALTARGLSSVWGLAAASEGILVQNSDESLYVFDPDTCMLVRKVLLPYLRLTRYVFGAGTHCIYMCQKHTECGYAVLRLDLEDLTALRVYETTSSSLRSMCSVGVLADGTPLVLEMSGEERYSLLVVGRRRMELPDFSSCVFAVNRCNMVLVCGQAKHGPTLVLLLTQFGEVVAERALMLSDGSLSTAALADDGRIVVVYTNGKFFCFVPAETPSEIDCSK